MNFFFVFLLITIPISYGSSEKDNSDFYTIQSSPKTIVENIVPKLSTDISFYYPEFIDAKDNGLNTFSSVDSSGSANKKKPKNRIFTQEKFYIHGMENSLRISEVCFKILQDFGTDCALYVGLTKLIVWKNIPKVRDAIEYIGLLKFKRTQIVVLSIKYYELDRYYYISWKSIENDNKYIWSEKFEYQNNIFQIRSPSTKETFNSDYFFTTLTIQRENDIWKGMKIRCKGTYIHLEKFITYHKYETVENIFSYASKRNCFKI